MKLSLLKIGQPTTIKAQNLFEGDDKDAIDHLVSFLENINHDIPKAIAELKTYKVGSVSNYTVQNLIGKIVRANREIWYTTLFK